MWPRRPACAGPGPTPNRGRPARGGYAAPPPTSWDQHPWRRAAPHPADGPPAPADLVKADLISEAASIAPGETLWVDLHLVVKPGWHVYWRNPGDSGLPTAIDWKLPSGFGAGHIRWPVPEHFAVGGIGNYGYSGSADLLIVSLPKDIGDLPVIGAIEDRKKAATAEPSHHAIRVLIAWKMRQPEPEDIHRR